MAAAAALCYVALYMKPGGSTHGILYHTILMCWTGGQDDLFCLLTLLPCRWGHFGFPHTALKNSHYSWYCWADLTCLFIQLNCVAGRAASVITPTYFHHNALWTGLVTKSQGIDDLSSMSWCGNSHLKSQGRNLICLHMDRPSTRHISLTRLYDWRESVWASMYSYWETR